MATVTRLGVHANTIPEDERHCPVCDVELRGPSNVGVTGPCGNEHYFDKISCAFGGAVLQADDGHGEPVLSHEFWPGELGA